MLPAQPSACHRVAPAPQDALDALHVSFTSMKTTPWKLSNWLITEFHYNTLLDLAWLSCQGVWSGMIKSGDWFKTVQSRSGPTFSKFSPLFRPRPPATTRLALARVGIGQHHQENQANLQRHRLKMFKCDFGDDVPTGSIRAAAKQTKVFRMCLNWLTCGVFWKSKWHCSAEVCHWLLQSPSTIECLRLVRALVFQLSGEKEVLGG